MDGSRLKLNKTMIVLFLIVLCTAVVGVYSYVPEPSPVAIKFIEFKPMHEILSDPEEAMERGIDGYIRAKYIGESEILIEKNGSIQLSYELEYISFNQEKKSCTVIIDPHNKFGTTIHQTLGDGKGMICLNDYIEFNLKGECTLKEGTVVSLVMKLNLPSTLPKTEIPFDLVGVSADVPIRIVNGGVRLIV